MNKLIAFLLSLLIGSQAFAQNMTGVGAETYNSISVNNATGVLIAAQKSVVYGVVVCNVNAANMYVKLYNKATAPTCGTDTPTKRIMAPIKACTAIPIPYGWQFSTGVGICTVTGIADSDATAPAANEILVTVAYN